MKLHIRIFLLSACVPLFLGCASRFTVPTETVGNLNGNNKIEMAITLQLSKELCHLEHDFEVGSVGILELKGDILCENAIEVATAAFSEVNVERMGEIKDRSSDHSRAIAILSPRFVDADNSVGMWTGSPNNMTISMEWPISTIDGKLIWTDTINGSAVVKGGTRFSHKRVVQRHLLMTLDDLFTKSYRSIISSREILSYAKR